MMSKPIPLNPELAKLLEESVDTYNNMSPEEKAKLHRAQAISWVYGNLAIENPAITREQVEKHFDEMYGKK